jgi:hypothetical protein
MGGEHFAAEVAKGFKPGAEVAGKLLVDFSAQTLSHGRALAGCRDRDLQVAAADDGAEVEIAIRDIVDAVAEDALLGCGLIDCMVHGWIVGGCNDEEHAIEVRRLEALLAPFNGAVRGHSADFRGCFRRNDA